MKRFLLITALTLLLTVALAAGAGAETAKAKVSGEAQYRYSNGKETYSMPIHRAIKAAEDDESEKKGSVIVLRNCKLIGSDPSPTTVPCEIEIGKGATLIANNVLVKGGVRADSEGSLSLSGNLYVYGGCTGVYSSLDGAAVYCRVQTEKTENGSIRFEPVNEKDMEDVSGECFIKKSAQINLYNAPATGFSFLNYWAKCIEGNYQLASTPYTVTQGVTLKGSFTIPQPAPEPEPVSVTAIAPIKGGELSKDGDLLLDAKKKAKVELAVSAADIIDLKTIKWATDNKKIATVKKTKGDMFKATITAKKPGEATITASIIHVNGRTQTVTIPVVAQAKPTSLDLGPDVSMLLGKTARITPVIEPANAPNKTVQYESENEAVASVDGEGMITARRVGAVKIKGITEEGGKKDSLIVNVRNDLGKFYFHGYENVANPSLTLRMQESKTIRLAVVVEPAAEEDFLQFESSDKGVLTVNDTGRVKIRHVGGALVTVTHPASGKSMTMKIIVEP